jgi:RNA polymerase sigma-70 factor (ECF subfamily)
VNTQPQNVTQLLKRLHTGDKEAPARLMPLVDEELRRLARHHLRHASANHSPQTTKLIQEAYLCLVDDQSVTWKDRAHFYRIAAGLMRRILVEHPCTHNRAKPGEFGQGVRLDEVRDSPGKNGTALAALNGALESFGRTYPRKSEVVELKFFGGLNTREISDVLQISETAVLRDWNFAKLWLCRELHGNAA